MATARAYTFRVEFGGQRFELAGQDMIYACTGGEREELSNGAVVYRGETRRAVTLEELERAAGQDDEELAETYRPLYEAALRLHDDAVGAGGHDCPTRPYDALAARREREAERRRQKMLHERYLTLKEAADRGMDVKAFAVGISPGSWNVPDRVNQGQIVLEGNGTVEVDGGRWLRVYGRLDQSDMTVSVDRIQLQPAK